MEIKAVYNNDGTLKASDTTAKSTDLGKQYVQTVSVENNTGAVLPGTGGIGTTIFYVLGLILVLGAGVLLVARKRVKYDK